MKAIMIPGISWNCPQPTKIAHFSKAILVPKEIAEISATIKDFKDAMMMHPHSISSLACERAKWILDNDYGLS